MASSSSPPGASRAQRNSLSSSAPDPSFIPKIGSRVIWSECQVPNIFAEEFPTNIFTVYKIISTNPTTGETVEGWPAGSINQQVQLSMNKIVVATVKRDEVHALPDFCNDRHDWMDSPKGTSTEMSMKKGGPFEALCAEDGSIIRKRQVETFVAAWRDKDDVAWAVVKWKGVDGYEVLRDIENLEG